MYTKQSPVPLVNSPRSPLLRQQSEKLIYDIHSTETSGNYIIDADILASQSRSRSRYLYCSFCQRVLQTKAGLTNHEKSHLRQELKQKRLERHKKLKKPRVYTCKECDEEFPERGLLNKHVKLHINIIRCNFCNETFKDRMEFEIHDAINDGKNYESLNFPAHRTRSQSRLSCHSVHVRSSSCDGAFFNGSRPPSELSDGGKTSSKRSFRSTSRLSMSSEILPRKKMKSVSAWIENNAYLSADDFSDTSSVSGRGLSDISSVWSEADFVQDRFICSEVNCMKTFPSLNWVTKHEIKEHKKLALFKCRECRKRFTTSGNLRQHKISTHPDVLICVLCDHPQKGVTAIEEHRLLHQKFSIKCDVCSKMFLSKYYLDEHLKHKAHRHKNYRKTKGTILIRVDRRETQNLVDVDELSSKIPSELKTYNNYKSDCNFTEGEDGSRLDDLPWRT